MHQTPRTTPTRIGVALGGGSARGYAHIGALAMLERHGLAPNLIVGTSFGAVIGALYASGRGVGELAADAGRLRRRDVFPHVTDFGLHKAALFEGRRLEAYFDQLLEGRSFADLEKPLYVVATDVDTGEQVLIDSGPVARALRASASLPGIFSPVELGGRRLVDGGIGSPVPLATLDEFDLDLKIGIGAGVTVSESRTLSFAQRALRTPFGRRVRHALGGNRRDGALARLGRALALTADSWLTPQQLEDALHVHTRPPISWLNFHKAEAAIRAGEEAMSSFMPRLHSALEALEPA